MDDAILLKTENLSKFFFARKGKSVFSLRPESIVVKAVNGISIDLKKGENYAVVGESGSGKTTLGYVMARVLEPTSGKLWFLGKEVTHLKEGELKAFRSQVQMVFQDPGSSLNPRHTIESILSLPLKIHTSLAGKEIRKRVADLLEAVHLPADLMPWHPGALSGGQKQRINLARVLILNPKLLILDEPTSALDVSVQAKILSLLKELKERLELTYLLITHDLSVVKNLADRIAVMYLGRVVELAPTASIFGRPAHPYTRALLSAIPVVTEEERKMIPVEVILEGEIPSPANIPQTCPFFSRCQEKQGICQDSTCPDLKEVEEGHFVRCVL